MEYRVILTDSDPIPGHHWAIVATPQEVLCFLSRPDLTACMLTEAWEGYRTMAEQSQLLAVG